MNPRRHDRLAAPAPQVDYPAACNAVEKVLVHEGLLAEGKLGSIRSALEAAGVTVSGQQASSHRGRALAGCDEPFR